MAYWRRVPQRTETTNANRKVPQIIAVAMMMAVGKLIKDLPFSAYTPYGLSVFRVSVQLQHLAPSIWQRSRASSLRPRHDA
jgi:hypothetical protein